MTDNWTESELKSLGEFIKLVFTDIKSWKDHDLESMTEEEMWELHEQIKYSSGHEED